MAHIVEQLDNGVVVYQVTDDPGLISNIYCERPYCSADSRSFLYARHAPDSGGFGWEYVLCEFDTWRERPVGKGTLASSISYNNDYYFLREAGDTACEMVRLDLSTGEVEVAFAFPDGLDRAGHPTVSPDHRYIAYGTNISFAPQRFGVEVADTHTGERRVVHEDPFTCNTHLQFHPTRPALLQVQHNRGCEFAPDGKRLRLVGDEGATVFLLDAVTGEVTRLAVGKPYTTPLTGHQTWVGPTDDIIMTVIASGDFSEEKGNILLVRASGSFRQIGAGWHMNHIGTTPCGRFFTADGSTHGDIIIGSPATGRAVLVCLSGASYCREFGQQAHPHAYLSPDFRWVVFNSDRTGRPQLYAAAISEDLLAGLD